MNRKGYRKNCLPKGNDENAMFSSRSGNNEFGKLSPYAGRPPGWMHENFRQTCFKIRVALSVPINGMS